MWLDQHAATIAAIGAVGAAIAAIILLVYARRQAGEMLQTRYDQYRPLVLPVDGPPIGADPSGYVYFDPDGTSTLQSEFRNIGPGPALNVRAVIYGPRPTRPTGLQPNTRTAILPLPLAAGASDGGESQKGVTSLPGETGIDGNPEHTLYAPPEPSADDIRMRGAVYVLARFTITYQDVFGRKHASIFDFTARNRWRAVGAGFFADIAKELEELNRAYYVSTMTQQAPPRAEDVMS